MSSDSLFKPSLENCINKVLIHLFNLCYVDLSIIKNVARLE